jgi:hypothetical protein
MFRSLFLSVSLLSLFFCLSLHLIRIWKGCWDPRISICKKKYEEVSFPFSFIKRHTFHVHSPRIETPFWYRLKFSFQLPLHQTVGDFVNLIDTYSASQRVRRERPDDIPYLDGFPSRLCKALGLHDVDWTYPLSYSFEITLILCSDVPLESDR